MPQRKSVASEKQLRKQRPAHLYKPGQSGNPKGRPPGKRAFSEMLRDNIDRNEVLRIFKKKLIGGNERIIEMYLNRTEGKVPDTVVQINAMFKESDEMNQRVIAWLRKAHPKLIPEFLKVLGINDR